MTVRVEVVTGANEFAHLTCSCGVDCYGGMRTLVTELPPEAIEAGKSAARRRLAQTWHEDDLTAHVTEILAAALGHITGDK